MNATEVRKKGGPKAAKKAGSRSSSRASETSRDRLQERVDHVVNATTAIDMHSHLFAPEFGAINLWGIDELLTYHYLVAEYFRAPNALKTAAFWALPKSGQADEVWRALFVDSTPISEAASGIVHILTSFGIDPAARDLREARGWFSARNATEHASAVLAAAGIDEVCMTNDPLDPAEAFTWERAAHGDGFSRCFRAALRLDRVINDLPASIDALRAQGYDVDAQFGTIMVSELRRFIANWISRMRPLYLAVSLAPEWIWAGAQARLDDRVPASLGNRVIREVIIPACREHDLPFALMIGVRRQVNPELRLAGDGVGAADVTALERLCSEFPETRFLATYLARENQHALCVAARKFSNLLPFGCWWFVNNPSLVLEITRMRMEMLGTTFIPQHSDSRVLEQVIYKWARARRIVSQVLAEAYDRVETAGLEVSDSQIKRDAERLLRGNFVNWTQASREGQAV